jgi:hypothetical protein
MPNSLPTFSNKFSSICHPALCNSQTRQKRGSSISEFRRAVFRCVPLGTGSPNTLFQDRILYASASFTALYSPSLIQEGTSSPLSSSSSANVEVQTYPLARNAVEPVRAGALHRGRGASPITSHASEQLLRTCRQQACRGAAPRHRVLGSFRLYNRVDCRQRQCQKFYRFYGSRPLR